MPNEETGENLDAAGQDMGEQIAQAATEPEAGEVEAQAAAETQTVPLAALEDERRKRQEAEAHAANLTAQFQMINQPRQQPQQPQGVLDGREDDDLLTIKEAKQLVSQVNETISRRTSANDAMTFINNKADFSDMVGVVTPQGIIPSDNLQDAMRTDPSLAADFYGGRLTYQALYRAAKGHSAEKKLAEAESRRAQATAQKNAVQQLGPQPAAAAGGGGAISGAKVATGLHDRETLLESRRMIERAAQGEFG